MAEKKTTKKTTERKPAARKTAVKKPPAKKAAPRPASKKAAKAADQQGGARVRVTLVRSVIGTRKSHRATVLGLGLKRRHQTVELVDTPAVRGMINKVNYLLKVEA
jgi:large subunit ribosomal protein L30